MAKACTEFSGVINRVKAFSVYQQWINGLRQQRNSQLARFAPCFFEVEGFYWGASYGAPVSAPRDTSSSRALSRTLTSALGTTLTTNLPAPSRHIPLTRHTAFNWRDEEVRADSVQHSKVFAFLVFYQQLPEPFPRPVDHSVKVLVA